jgi:hypothetical protein
MMLLGKGLRIAARMKPQSVWLLQATVTLVLIVLNLRFHPRSYPQAFPEQHH